MSQNISIRWHSRAGQGAITAGQALAEILGGQGKFVQCFPEFGAEKHGAPVTVFNRISDKPLTDVSQPQVVDVVTLLDTTLVSSCEVTPPEILAKLRPNGKLLVNTSQTQLDFTNQLKNIYGLDASAIATQEIGRDIPNVPMLGALIRIAELAALKDFLVELKNYLARGLPEKIVAGNLRAFEKGYDEVQKLK